MSDPDHDSAEELYEQAPCGYLTTFVDGTIARVNETLVSWLGYDKSELIAHRRFSDLLTVGGKIYYETHFAPLLQLQGEVGGIALDLRTSAGGVLPVLVTARLRSDPDGSPRQIRITVFDARDRRAYERELLAARQAADADRTRLRQLVADLQRSLLPPVLPTVAGLQSAAYYHPASDSEVGGDFYDLFPLPDRRWGFLLGDVCGKGIDAAAITARARYTLRASAAYDQDPAAGLRLLNTILGEEQLGSALTFCTAVFGVLTPHADGFTATLASGGHADPLLLRASGTADYLPLPRGPLIGVLPSPRYTAVDVNLAPGDTLLLFTDGLTEARDDDERRRYGEDRLLTFAQDHSPTDAARIITAVTDLLGSFGDGLDDDTALLALSVDAGRP